MVTKNVFFNFHEKEDKQRTVLDTLGTSTSQVLSATFDDTLRDNPEWLLWRMHRIKGSGYDPTMSDIVEYENDLQEKDRISKDDFDAIYAEHGLEWDSQMTHQTADYLLEQKKRRQLNQYIISKGKGGLGEAVGRFGATILASSLSPINIGASFIPVVRESRWAAIASKSPLLATTLKGSVGLGAFQTAYEPLKAYSRHIEQEDYTLEEAIENIGMAAVLGGALHSVGYGAKKLKDVFFRNELKLNDHTLDNTFKEEVQNLMHSDFTNITTHKPESIELLEKSILDTRKYMLALRNKYKDKLHDYFKHESRIATFKEQIHTKYNTNWDLEKLPHILQKEMKRQEQKLEQLRLSLSKEPMFNKYESEYNNLSVKMKEDMQKLQLELQGYDLDPSKILTTLHQLNEGQYVNLESPEFPQSIYDIEYSKPANQQTSKPANWEAVKPANHLNVLTENIKATQPEIYKNLLEQNSKIEEVQKYITDIFQKLRSGVTIAEFNNIITSMKASNIDEALIREVSSLSKKFIPNNQLHTIESHLLDELHISYMQDAEIAKRTQAINIIKYHEAENFISKHANKKIGLRELIRKADIRSRTIADEMLCGLFNDLQKIDAVHTFKSKEYEKDIARELWNLTYNKFERGYTGNAKALKIAQIINKWQTTSRTRANTAGGYIQEIAGYITRQTHAQSKLKKMGYEKWYNFINPLLDHTKTKVDLKDAYTNLTSGIHYEHLDYYLGIPTVSNTQNIAKRISGARKIHFKDADSFLKYNQECGEFNIKDSIMLELANMGKTIGVLESLGCNPKYTYDALKTRFAAELADENLLSLNRAFEIIMGNTAPENQLIADVGTGLRAWKSMSFLGKVVINSIGDLSSSYSVLRNQGMKRLESLKTTISSAVKSMSSKERREFAMHLGIASEELLGHTYDRINPEYGSIGTISKMSNLYFKLNLMQWWDNSLKSAMAINLSKHLSYLSNMTFDQLDKRLKVSLEKNGIGKTNWHLLQHLNQNEKLIPDMNLVPDEPIIKYLHENQLPVNQINILRVKQDTCNALRRYIRDSVDNAVPTGDAIDRASLSILPSGTILGEVYRCLMQFKTYSFNLTRRNIGSSLFGNIPMHERQGGFKDALKGVQDMGTLSILTEFAVMASSLAYLSMCANALIENKEIPDYQDTSTWKAAVVKGGGLGLFGDYFFKEFDRYNRRIESEIGGPIMSDLIELIYWGNDDQKKLLESDKQITNYLKRNTPGQNIFYIRPVLKMMME